ncbi:hypothetical protein [Parvularcula lutaonensis]|uniref:Uncharacterized protein n=1 Tax=Parvularcula lutaonensis TaxID=491923 RepID=A0ABV7M8M0_9PROT|nr:hypothetical protein [Parvularcula lutaonensis]
MREKKSKMPLTWGEEPTSSPLRRKEERGFGESVLSTVKNKTSVLLLTGSFGMNISPLHWEIEGFVIEVGDFPSRQKISGFSC